MADRPLDLVCIGRAAVDLYGEQVGTRLEDVASFAKYLGGCAANIAVGTARLGLRPAMVARVGDEQMGRFVREQLAREGVDVSRVRTDPARLTALVLLGIRDGRTMPHIFYRTDCADMALEADDIEKDFIAAAGALLVTGTHFSSERVDRASRTAIRYAKESGTRVVFDIDYRPVLWGLTGHAEGESRFVASGTVTGHLQSILQDCDLVVGTEEEIAIAGGSTEVMQAVRNIRAVSGATIVVKRGPMGCVVFPDAIPPSIEDGIKGPGFPVEVFNTLGAGDGFMSGFLRGFLRDLPLEECARFANACGAIVVSRHGCCPASPSWTELQHFLTRGSPHFRLREDPVLNHIHRATTRVRRWPEVMALAFDHRSQFEELARRNGAGPERIPALKGLIGEAVLQTAQDLGLEGAGVLCDDRFGQEVLDRLTGQGIWIARPVELPGSRPLAFEHGANIGTTLRAVPAEHVVKCLVFYHPDDPEDLRAAQDAELVRLYRACEATRLELLLEVIPPKDGPAVGPDTVARALARIYAGGVFPDWWKLPPPDAAGWDAIERVIREHDPHCRGVLLLGLEAPPEELAQGFAAAASRPLCRGFAVGRSIFAEPAAAWLRGESDDAQTVAAIARGYRELIERWRAHAATA